MFCDAIRRSFTATLIATLFTFSAHQDGENHSLHQSFAVHAHIAAIRSVHSSKRYLASGGADDRTYIYDMKTRQEIQVRRLADLDRVRRSLADLRRCDRLIRLWSCYPFADANHTQQCREPCPFYARRNASAVGQRRRIGGRHPNGLVDTRRPLEDTAQWQVRQSRVHPSERQTGAHAGRRFNTKNVESNQRTSGTDTPHFCLLARSKKRPIRPFSFESLAVCDALDLHNQLENEVISGRRH